MNSSSLPTSLMHAISERLRAAQRILITTHIRPDGDAIGSLLGMGLALQSGGKVVQMALEDGIPQSLRFLSGSAEVRARPEGTFDCWVVLDTSDLRRIAARPDGVEQPDINIDHHHTNEQFATVNLVVPEAVATTEILAHALPEWGFPLTAPVAEALLTGLITDTIGFRTYNMRPEVLRTAADLMALGANLSDLYNRALVTRSFESVRFWGAGLSKISRMGGIAWTTLTMEDRELAGYPGRDDADLINLMTTMTGIDINLIFVEQPNGRVKVSWRAVAGLDVSAVAMKFGGGGHPAAAGAEIQGALDDVVNDVLQATRELLTTPEIK